jgi:hypothetical protein
MLHTIPNAKPAYRLGSARQGQKIHLIVNTAGVTVRLAADRNSLELDTPFGGPQGLQFTSADAVIEMQWSGEIWALGVAANASNPVVDFSVT